MSKADEQQPEIRRGRVLPSVIGVGAAAALADELGPVPFRLIAGRVRDTRGPSRIKEAIESQRFLRPGAIPLFPKVQIDPRGRFGAYDASQPWRGVIYGDNPTTIAHELGHATGRLAQARRRAGDQGVARVRAFQAVNNVGRFVPLLSAVPAGMAARARTAEELDRAEKANRATALASALANAPTVLEEGRAWVRGAGLLKKMTGQRIHVPQALASYGTYLGSAAASVAAPYLLNRRIINKRRRLLQQEGN